MTFLIIEHNMGLVAALCDHVVVLVQGKRFTEGRFAELRAIRACRKPTWGIGRDHALHVTNVVAGYGAHDEVLKGVGITVAERELVVLIGPNGAGKSTLLKSIAGFLQAARRRDHLRGQADRRPQAARDHPAGHRLRAAGGERISLAQRRGQSGDGRLCGPPRDQRAHAGRVRALSRSWPSGARRRRARSPAASARCSRSRWR